MLQYSIRKGTAGVPRRIFWEKIVRRVKIKAYAKLNLTLEITGVEQGYHMLDSLVTSIDVFDLIVLKKRKGKLSCIKMKGLGSERIPPEKNNALKAAEAFSAAFDTDGADITVYKNIPMGAGLGGSSADVAGVLNGMAQLYGVTDRVKLKEIADTLGSDTGYMLDGGFARLQGRGEKVTKLLLQNKLYFLLLCPDSEVSTPACYQKYDQLPKTLEYRGSYTENAIAVLEQKKENELGMYAMNDLFKPALQLNTDVETAWKQALNFSPICAMMTGSGSAVFAMFETKELCAWAKSRYRGKFRTILAQSVVPDYTKKISGFWKNPFVVGDIREE